MTNIEKLGKAKELVHEVFLNMEANEFYEHGLNCAMSDIGIVKIKMEVENEFWKTTMKGEVENGS